VRNESWLSLSPSRAASLSRPSTREKKTQRTRCTSAPAPLPLQAPTSSSSLAFLPLARSNPRPSSSVVAPRARKLVIERLEPAKALLAPVEPELVLDLRRRGVRGGEVRLELGVRGAGFGELDLEGFLGEEVAAGVCGREEEGRVRRGAQEGARQGQEQEQGGSRGGRTHPTTVPVMRPDRRLFRREQGGRGVSWRTCEPILTRSLGARRTRDESDAPEVPALPQQPTRDPAAQEAGARARCDACVRRDERGQPASGGRARGGGRREGTHRRVGRGGLRRQSP